MDWRGQNFRGSYFQDPMVLWLEKNKILRNRAENFINKFKTNELQKLNYMRVLLINFFKLISL